MAKETQTMEGNKSPFLVLHDEISGQIQSSDKSFEDKAKTETQVLQAILDVVNGVEDAEDKLDKILKSNNIKVDKSLIPKPKEKNPFKRFWNNVKKPFKEIKKKLEDAKRWWKKHGKIITIIISGIILIIAATIIYYYIL